MSSHAPIAGGEHPNFLKAKFQIGSINGKQSYKDSERVFHPNDMPKPAKEARQQILGMLEASTAARQTWWNNGTSNGPLNCGKMNAAWDDKPSEHKRLQLERQLEKSRDNTGLKLGGDPTVSCDRPMTFTLTVKDAIKSIHDLRARTGFGGRGVPSGTSMRTYSFTEGNQRITDFNLSTGFDPKENRAWKKPTPIKDENHLNLVDRETKFTETQRARKEIQRTQALMESHNEAYSFDHYKHDPLKTSHYLDTHPSRDQALASTYTPKVLDTYMTRLAAGQAFAPPSLADSAGSTVTPLPASDKLPHPEELEAKAAALEASRSSSAILSRSGSAHTFSTATALAASTILRKTNVVKQYEHQGSWAHVPAENGMAWSCCMSNDRNSRGCTVKVVNRDRWNYEGPNSFDR